MNNTNATTPAPPGVSAHNAGFAVDIKWDILPDKSKQLVLENAKKAGIKWGGTFTKPDKVHFYFEPYSFIERFVKILDAQRQDQGGNICDCSKQKSNFATSIEFYYLLSNGNK